MKKKLPPHQEATLKNRVARNFKLHPKGKATTCVEKECKFPFCMC